MRHFTPLLLLATLACAGTTPRPATGPSKAKRELKATLKLTIRDTVFFHNMSIAFNGKHYFAVNGGNTDYGMVNEYDTKGKLVRSKSIPLDGRAILYDSRNNTLLIKTYENDVHEYSPRTGSTEKLMDTPFSWEQSSPGITEDGKYFVEQEYGDVNIINAETGEVEEELTGFPVNPDEYPFNEACAVGKGRVFVWNGEREVHASDFEGNVVGSFTLPAGNFGFSLSWANGMLWVSDDADGGSDGAVGTWYGYEIDGL